MTTDRRQNDADRRQSDQGPPPGVKERRTRMLDRRRGAGEKRLRAGLIGLGMMGRHHGRVLGSLDGVDLVAVADEHGDPHGVAGGRPLLKSLDDLLEHDLDYCVVAVPTIHHESVGLALAEAGVNALIEKPLAQDIASAERLAHAFDDNGLIGAVGHIERYNPALQEARRRIAAGELESPLLPLDETVAIVDVLDDVRRQLGVAFPGEAA